MPNIQDSLTTKAINAALNKNWKEAVTTNKEILEYDNQNIQALNRLAKAYLELEKYEDARKTVKQVLKLDPINQTAQKNLVFAEAKRKVLGSMPHPNVKNFIKEPGTTKEFTLQIEAKGVTAKKFYVGEELAISSKDKLIAVCKASGDVMAHFNDQTSATFHSAVKKGAFLKSYFSSGDEKEMTIIVKSSIPIFLSEKQDLKPYIKTETLEEPEMDSTMSGITGQESEEI